MEVNKVHYLVDENLPNAEYIFNSINPNYKDRLEKFTAYNLRTKIEKQELPNSSYDIGFIFSSTHLSQTIIAGYHLVEVDERFPEIDIIENKNLKGSGKNKSCRIKMSQTQNLPLVKKLLLAPLIEHYIFYQKNDSETAKILKIFPNNKFKKESYSSKRDLESNLSIHLRNKGRLVRALIFVNEDNIHECAAVMDSNLNLGTFHMICNMKRNKINQSSLAAKYPDVTFS